MFPNERVLASGMQKISPDGQPHSKRGIAVPVSLKVGGSSKAPQLKDGARSQTWMFLISKPISHLKPGSSFFMLDQGIKKIIFRGVSIC